MDFLYTICKIQNKKIAGQSIFGGSFGSLSLGMVFGAAEHLDVFLLNLYLAHLLLITSTVIV